MEAIDPDGPFAFLLDADNALNTAPSTTETKPEVATASPIQAAPEDKPPSPTFKSIFKSLLAAISNQQLDSLLHRNTFDVRFDSDSPVFGGDQDAIVAAVSSFANEAIDFDDTVHKSIKWIQELELVAKGCKLTTVTAHANLDKSNSQLRCQILRATCASIISTALASLNSTTTHLDTLSPSPLTPYWHPNDLDDLSVIQSAKESLSPHSLDGLKLSLVELKLHRIWFCQRVEAVLNAIADLDLEQSGSPWLQTFIQFSKSLDSLILKWSKLRHDLNSALTNESDSTLSFEKRSAATPSTPLLKSLTILEKTLHSARLKLLVLSQDIHATTSPLSPDTITTHLDSIQLDTKELNALLDACRASAQGTNDTNVTQERDASQKPKWRHEDEDDGTCEGTRAFTDLSIALEDVGEEEVFEGTPDAKEEKVES
ncbi:hypothetical protein HDU79_011022 [Rhizoclosmatium sp. JEL0117]|nr:hypothetical protein HDU79_011022 [Rhizoclosmatium sp. JEL0117]